MESEDNDLEERLEERRRKAEEWKAKRREDNDLEERRRKAEEWRAKREKQEKNSIQGFLLTILFYGGIGFVLLLLLYGLGEMQPTPDVDRLPPSWNP